MARSCGCRLVVSHEIAIVKGRDVVAFAQDEDILIHAKREPSHERISCVSDPSTLPVRIGEVAHYCLRSIDLLPVPREGLRWGFARIVNYQRYRDLIQLLCYLVAGVGFVLAL